MNALELDGQLRALAEAERFGGAVLLAERGTTLLLDAYGLADRERGIAATTETMFQIASISKQFTAAAVLLLAESGRLSVEDVLPEFLPVPKAWSRITLHQLLTHTSGIGHWLDFPQISLFEAMDPVALRAAFAARRLHFAPGTDWRYSSPGYVLLAHAIESATGMKYAELVRALILQPLGLQRTFVGNQVTEGVARAQGYSGDELAPSFDLGTVGMGAGDVWSTVRDMARWDSALGSDAILSEASRATMFDRHAEVRGFAASRPGSAYGYGWIVEPIGARRVYYHTGDNAGFAALNAWIPDDNGVVVILANDDRVDVDALLRTAIEVVGAR